MKKALKRSLSILLAITIIFSSAYVGLSEVEFSKIDLGGLLAVKAKAATYGTTGGCIWSLDGTVLTISGNGEMANYNYDSTLPWGKSITEVVIDNGVTSIGEHAFYGSKSLTSVTIPDSVTSIGYAAFYDCTSLESVYITDLVAWCGIEFYDYSNPLYHANNLYINGELATDIVIPNVVTSIGEYAFQYCTSLISITIPSSITSIGNYAFSGCTSLESVYITDLAAWCSIAFGYSVDWPGYYCSSNPLYFAKNLYINGELVTDIVIPDGVTNISDYAFEGFENLTSITIPDSVTSIGTSAFMGCTSLSVAALGSGVQTVGYSAFYDCKSLSAITIPDSVTIIVSCAFYGCTSLVSAVIGNNVTYIGSNAFYNCTNLTSITIPDSVTNIISAFEGCTSLTSVTIGNGVTNISSAFEYCYSLENVYVTDLAAWCGIEFYDYYSNPLYYAKNLYINGELATDIVVPNGVTSIGEYAFYNYKSLKSITIPDSVTNIGSSAFEGCTSLASVTIGNGVTNIGSSAFDNCSSLTSITIPDSVTSIGSEAFETCTSLTSVTIGNGVTSIGADVFYNCKSLTAINVSADNTAYSSVDGVLFNNKTKLIQYPGGKIDEFYIIPGFVKSFDSSAFYGADFKSIVLGESYTNVMSGLFQSCSSLENVVIPANITSISSNVFSGCYNIKNVFYGGFQDEWESIAIASGNTDLTNKRIHYNVDVDDWENHCTKPVVTKEPTCTSNGTQTSTCPCGYDVTETIYSLGHTYPDEWKTQAPTCENSGYDYRECTVCGYRNTTNWVDSLGHSWSSKWTVDREPTCTEDGYKTRHCTVCDEGTDYMTIYANGHISSDKWTIEWNATCTNKGRKYKECTICHEPMSYEYIPTVPHKSSGWIVDRNPTCTRAGLKHTECDWCGEVFAEERISALGHTSSDWIIDNASTVNAKGSKHKECTVCGATVETVVIPQIKPATPKLTSVINTTTGVKFTWGKVTGADSYVVYRRTYNASTKKWSGWANLGKVTATSFVDKTAKSGTYYIYTARAGNEAGYSSYDATGLKTYFLSRPTLASVANSSAGVTVKWNAVTGATNYIVYRRTYNASIKKWGGWTNLGKTTATSFADKTAKSGTYYIYTVKAIAGAYTSAYNATGLKTYFLSTPALSSATSTTSGVKFTWGKVAGANGYIVYRRTYNATTKTWSGWSNLATVTGNTKVSYLDASAQKGTYYIYTTKAYYGSYTSAYNTTGLKVKDIY